MRAAAGSVGGEQGQPLTFRQVPRSDHKKVPPIKGRDLALVEAARPARRVMRHGTFKLIADFGYEQLKIA
jgi:hypothetical protein